MISSMENSCVQDSIQIICSPQSPMNKIIKISQFIDGFSRAHRIGQLIDSIINSQDALIDLDLRTDFDSYFSLMEFLLYFERFSHQIRYLKWEFHCDFTSDEEAKSIGASIACLKNVYRLSLEIRQSYFPDVSGESLGGALSNLNQLRVFSLSIKYECGVARKRMSPYGYAAINAGVNMIPNLEIIHWADFQRQRFIASNKIAFFEKHISTLTDRINPAIITSFRHETNLVQHLITNMLLSGEVGCHPTFVPSVTLVSQLLTHCFGIPYLTMIQYEIKCQRKSNQADLIYILLSQFLKEKLRIILQSLPFMRMISQTLPINPYAVYLDLYF